MKNKIHQFLDNGILISPELINSNELSINSKVKNLPLVFDKNTLDNIKNNIEIDDIDWLKYDTEKVNNEKNGIISLVNLKTPKIQILTNYAEQNTSKSIKDFVSLYNQRYRLIMDILRQRPELRSSTSIRKVFSATERETVSVIGIIYSLSITKNGNIMLEIEDQTGILKAVVTKNNSKIFLKAEELTADEVIGLQGVKGNGIVFVTNIIFPDIPITKELKKSPEDEAAVFIGDAHIGSNYFIRESFEKFILWIKGNSTEHKKQAKQVKYLFIVGDLVEGIGIFPGQENELEIKDIYKQYEDFSYYIKQIPNHIKIIICPGNHDALRVAEPQPTIPEMLLPELYNLEHISFVSSPSLVRFGSTNSFQGFDALIYHGFSFPYYAANIGSIRLSGGLEKTENIMTYLLKKRHLAPTHGSTQYQLGYKEDPLVIKSIPDFFISGHIHRASFKNYRGITLLNCSCWITQTKYQEKRGLVPQPAKALYIDLKTRENTMLNFE